MLLDGRCATIKCCACTSFCVWFLLEGTAGEHWGKTCVGAGAGSGEPHERRQQGQRSGRRLWPGDSAKTEGCEEQSKDLTN